MATSVMSSFFGVYLCIFGVIFLLLTFCKPREAKLMTSKSFKKFQHTFLLVYLIMFAGDWLQGPTVYALYSTYGFTRQENGILFIAGFGCSMVMGTFAGSLADKYGRRMNCVLYGVLYSICCLTKHVNDFRVLMFGRLMGGIATSILWSAFESWMVSEHHTRGFEESWVSDTFSLMSVGNGLCAILSGLIAQGAVWLYDHPVGPFDASLVLLVLGTVIIMATWTENYGDANSSMGTGLADAMKAITGDRKVLLLGTLQSLFEGAMYTFVFMWTPSLEDTVTGPIPYGLIFSTFMLCCSIGGSIFGYLVSQAKVEQFMQGVFCVAAVCMAVPLLTRNPVAIMGSFCVYEMCVGIFWPGIGTMRSKYVPEQGRATIMNIFRVPLNFLVVSVLYYQASIPVSRVFMFCSSFNIAATICMMLLWQHIQNDKKYQELAEVDVEK